MSTSNIWTSLFLLFHHRELNYLTGVVNTVCSKQCKKNVITTHSLFFNLLCSKVYTKVGYTQLKSDECVFVCQEDTVRKGSKSTKNRQPIVSLTEMSARMMNWQVLFWISDSITKQENKRQVNPTKKYQWFEWMGFNIHLEKSVWSTRIGQSVPT